MIHELPVYALSLLPVCGLAIKACDSEQNCMWPRFDSDMTRNKAWPASALSQLVYPVIYHRYNVQNKTLLP